MHLPRSLMSDPSLSLELLYNCAHLIDEVETVIGLSGLEPAGSKPCCPGCFHWAGIRIVTGNQNS
jgi:hypothetical protein